jgi:hypothetical protein
MTFNPASYLSDHGIIDHAGLHGHFLSHVINKYFFGKDSEKVFTSSGSAHYIKKEFEKHNMPTIPEHISADNKLYSKSAKFVIYIKHYIPYDFIALTNSFYRDPSLLPYDATAEQIGSMHLGNIEDASSEQSLRHDWCSKLSDRSSQSFFKRIDTPPIDTLLPRYIFNYKSFFDFNRMLLEMQDLSKFLNLEFKFDNSFVELYNTFLNKNQGFCQYNHCHKILHNIFNNNDYIFNANWQEQAYINFMLSKTYILYNEELSNNEKYPTNTKHISEIIDQQVSL